MTDGFALKSWVISLVNKVTKKSNKYSTDETVVGTWVDGRPIYRKVVEESIALPDSGVGVTHNFGFEKDVDTLISAIGIFNNGVSYIYCDIQDSGCYMKLYDRATVKSIIFEYTKTTDKATT